MKVALWVCVVAGCAHDVSQDARTGRDGHIGGARPIALDHNEGKSRGIVTYPGGDRVDWKSIALPDAAHGTLELDLRYKTPRPGLQVAFDVFDQWHQPVGNAKAGGKRARSAKIENARGTYFVRVYAPRRGDAGEYVLAARFAPDRDPVDPMGTIAIADPPRLPAVDDDTPPPLVTPPTTPTPPPPVTPPTPPVTPPSTATPVVARVQGITVQGNALIAIVSAGSNRSVTNNWRVEVLAGDTNKPLVGARARIVRVDAEKTVVRVDNLTVDQLNANLHVRFSPP